jgi:hypothetical protein
LVIDVVTKPARSTTPTASALSTPQDGAGTNKLHPLHDHDLHIAVSHCGFHPDGFGDPTLAG